MPLPDVGREPRGHDGARTIAWLGLAGECALAAGVVGSSLGARAALDGVLGDRAPIVLAFLALVALAWLVRTWVFVAAAAAALLATTYLFVPPRHSLAIQDAGGAIQVLSYIGVIASIGLSARVARRHAARLRAAQAAAEREQALLRALLDNLPAGVSVASGPPDCRVTALNRFGQELLGRPAAEITGRRVGEHAAACGLLLADGVTPPDPARMPLYRAARAGETISGEEFVLCRPDGSRRVLSVSAAPVRDAAGAPIGAVNCWIDVTERKRVEEELRRSEERLRRAQRAARVGTWEWDLESGKVELSEGIFDLLGSEPGSFAPSAESWRSRMHPEDRDPVFERLSRAIESGAPEFYEEYRIIQDDGSPRWLAAPGRIERDAQGRAVRLIGANYDITDRKHAELEAQRGRLFFERLTAAAPCIIYMHDLKDGRSLFISDAADRVLGYPPGFLGRRGGWMAPELTHPDDLAALPAYTAGFAAIKGAGVHEREHRVRHADGSWRWFRSSDTVYEHDADGAPRVILGMALDITGRRATEEQLEHHREELENLVRRRTVELEASQGALRQAERLVALGTLARGLGHDLNNLLMPLRARVEALEQEPGLTDQGREDLKAMRGVAEYLAALTRGLRLFGREPDGPTPVESTDLGAWASDLRPLLRSMLPARVTLQCDVPDGLPRVSIGTHQLSQVAVNLVQNARDAILSSGAGSEAAGRIIVSARALGAGSLELAFRDDGPGMSEEVRRRCMEPFFTTKARGRGTGLGLAIVHGVAAAADGEVTIESAPGRGTVVRLRLPTADDAARGPGPRDSRPDGARDLACVTLSDPRAAAFARSIVGLMGLEAVAGPPGAARLWITDAVSTEPDAVRTFLAGGPGRRVVATGANGGAEALAGAGATVVPIGAGLVELRLAVMAAAPGAAE